MKNIAKFYDEPFEIDGDLTKKVWQEAIWSPRFIDVIGGTPALYNTRSAIVFDDEALTIAFDCESPYPKASMTEDGDLLWFDNDVEVFIDGGDTYYELQVNAYNTIYEAFYIWRDAYKENPLYAQQQEFDVIKNDARVFGGNHDRKGLDFWNGSHPRGNRWAFLNWKMEGLQTAVKVNGELNNDEVVSQSVTYEIRIPWKSMVYLANGRLLPPQHLDQWRIFLGRYENLRVNGVIVPVGWSWDIVGSDDNHVPEKFTLINFVR